MKARRYASPGQRNNFLTLIDVHCRKPGANTWLAQCDCGNPTIVNVGDFNSGHTKSCGCHRRDVLRVIKRTHGMTETAEYRAWCHIRDRCEREANAKYDRYGGRGIKVCDRWQVFENFLSDMGKKPSRWHSIERNDNDGDYEPSNCRWATMNEQAQNKSNNVMVLVDGEKVCVSEAERRLGISGGAINQRARKTGESYDKIAAHFTVRRNETRSVS